MAIVFQRETSQQKRALIDFFALPNLYKYFGLFRPSEDDGWRPRTRGATAHREMLSLTRQLQRAVPRGFPAVAVETLRETLASQQVRASLDPEPLRPQR